MTAETTKNTTSIESPANTPFIRIVREFDAPPEKVFQAWIEPELVSQWLGPDNTGMNIDEWNAVTGGAYRYAAVRDGEEIAAFYGSFHEVRPNTRLVQTFTYVEVPNGVSLDTATFEDLGNGRTRVTIDSVLDSVESRDGMIASGMETGVVQGYAKLDRLLAQ